MLVATGQYLGEGFDCPKIDALFMTFPVAFRGKLVQYVGRILREYPGKQDAPASVVRIDMDQTEHIIAVCRRGKYRQSVPILDLPLPSPPPAGAEWIEAYRR